MNVIDNHLPVANPTEIQKTLEVLFTPDARIELRSIKKSLYPVKRPAIRNDFYDGVSDWSALITQAVKLNSEGFNTYVTMNPVGAAVKGRGTTDKEILLRRWLLLDIDPERPADTPATDEQLEQALKQTEKIRDYLTGCGWPAPVEAESGNGGHLLYLIDLPNTTASNNLVKGVLKTLGKQFDTPACHVDQSVSNAARIVKLHGTVSTKGQHSPERPWRLSRLTRAPETLTVVTVEQLEALTTSAKAEKSGKSRTSTVKTGFDLEDFLERNGLEFEKEDVSEGVKYHLDHCPFNSEHGVRDSAVIHYHSGSLGFKCFHNSCADKNWKDVRALYDAEHLKMLAELTQLDYQRQRAASAKNMGIPATSLDRLVKQLNKEAISPNSMFPEVEAAEDPVNGADLLSDISDAVLRFLVCSKEAADTVALWCVMTWLMDSIVCAPLLNITAPEKNCGKTTLLDFLKKLVYRPLMTSNISTAAVFRSIELWKPTLLLDEADTFMNENEELRGVINSGHTVGGAFVIRTVGEDFTPTRFSTWCAKALAGIGKRAATIEDRSINIHLRRKTITETTESMRDVSEDYFPSIASRIARFAEDNAADIKASRPVLPKNLIDRVKDNWGPLAAIADAAGGGWPERARQVVVAMANTHDEDLPVGVELLIDIKEVFEAKGVDKLKTSELVQELCRDLEKRWATYNKRDNISPKQLNNILKPYKITSKNLKVAHQTVNKGYSLNQFEDAFARYIPQNNEYPHSPLNLPLPATFPRKPTARNVPQVAAIKNTENAKKVPATRITAAQLGLQPLVAGSGKNGGEEGKECSIEGLDESFVKIAVPSFKKFSGSDPTILVDPNFLPPANREEFDRLFS